MKHRTHINLAIAIILSLNATASIANQEKTPTGRTIDSFLLDKERGWYWYEALPEEEKEKVRQDILDNSPNVIKKTQKPNQPQEPKDKPLSTAWFKENFPKYRDAAIDNPYDKEAMRNYLFLEKFMRDRATAFGYERQKAVYAEPFLDASSTRPLASFGMKEMNHQAAQQKDLILTNLGKESGIYFFYLSTCNFCEKQAPLLKGLEREYGFNIKPVSLDGKKMANSFWDSFLTDKGQAASLGVQQVPATYLFNPKTQKVELIAQGLQSLPDLEKRIIYAASRAGLISDSQAQTIRATGLYQSVDGHVSGGFPMPADAPKEFKMLYEQSQNQQGQ